jgi:phosphatidylserine/phosphatidylglycerophosphate/cardiolipin synthase-like enzyme
MTRTFLATLILLASPAFADELPPIYTSGDATVCFTSGNHSTIGGDCAALAVAEIGKARRTLLVQAYNFTELHIIAAIVAAHARGVAVTVLLDKISASQKGEGADAVHDAGIPVYVDRRPKIAHNKVMIIDGTTVLTGSFNWSHNAECCNAENMLVLRRPDLAEAYRENFERRQAVSVEYVRKVREQR